MLRFVISSLFNNINISKLEAAFTALMSANKKLCPLLTDVELDFLKSGLTISEFKPKQFYLEANTVQKTIGFVYSGLVRSYYVDHNGNEKTINFIQENKYATHYTSFVKQMPSKYYFQCIEPTIIVNLSYQHIQDGYDKFPNVERYGRLIAEAILHMQQKRIESFLFENAETRYLNFIKENPELFNRVSISDLSSYLGIERQSLTRIRKKIAQNTF